MSGLPVRSTQFAVGETCLFIGVCLIARVRSLLQGAALRTLGKLSFSIYLVHFPLLLTLACWVFLALHLHLQYGIAAFSASMIGIAVTFPVAVLFQRMIDGPAINLSRTISRLRCFRVSTTETPTSPPA
jgi:peptidoglycan/LPS O-acetylase OafA/YrhL